MPKKRLTVEAIDAIEDRPAIEVDVPLWDGTVLIQALTLQQLNQCSERATDKLRGEVNPHIRNGWYLVEGMVDPKITLTTAEKWLTERNAQPSAEILHAILTATGLTRDAVEDAKSEPESGPAAEVPDQTGRAAIEDATPA